MDITTITRLLTDAATPSLEERMFIVTKRSAYLERECLLGYGETETEALADAYGPKPWSPQQAKSAKSANIREVSQDELNELLWA